MDDKQFRQLLNRLDAIVKLLALNLPKEMKLSEKIVLLRNMGFPNKQIAQILGTSPKYVGVALDRAKKEKKKSRGQSGISNVDRK